MKLKAKVIYLEFSIEMMKPLSNLEILAIVRVRKFGNTYMPKKVRNIIGLRKYDDQIAFFEDDENRIYIDKFNQEVGVFYHNLIAIVPIHSLGHYYIPKSVRSLIGIDRGWIAYVWFNNRVYLARVNVDLSLFLNRKKEENF